MPQGRWGTGTLSPKLPSFLSIYAVASLIKQRWQFLHQGMLWRLNEIIYVKSWSSISSLSGTQKWESLSFLLQDPSHPSPSSPDRPRISVENISPSALLSWCAHPSQGSPDHPWVWRFNWQASQDSGNLLRSCSRFLIVKGYGLQSAKGKGS